MRTVNTNHIKVLLILTTLILMQFLKIPDFDLSLYFMTIEVRHFITVYFLFLFMNELHIYLKLNYFSLLGDKITHSIFHEFHHRIIKGESFEHASAAVIIHRKFEHFIFMVVTTLILTMYLIADNLMLSVIGVLLLAFLCGLLFVIKRRSLVTLRAIKQYDEIGRHCNDLKGLMKHI